MAAFPAICRHEPHPPVPVEFGLAAGQVADVKGIPARGHRVNAGWEVGFGLLEFGLEVAGLKAVGGARWGPHPGRRVERPRHVVGVVVDAEPVQLNLSIGGQFDLRAVWSVSSDFHHACTAQDGVFTSLHWNATEPGLDRVVELSHGECYGLGNGVPCGVDKSVFGYGNPGSGSQDKHPAFSRHGHGFLRGQIQTKGWCKNGSWRGCSGEGFCFTILEEQTAKRQEGEEKQGPDGAKLRRGLHGRSGCLCSREGIRDSYRTEAPFQFVGGSMGRWKSRRTAPTPHCSYRSTAMWKKGAWRRPFERAP